MSSFSIGQMNQLGDAFQKVGFTADELRELGQSEDTLRDLRGILRGTHVIRGLDHFVDLGEPCKLPFDGAERVSPAKSGVAKIERIGDELFLTGEKINLFLSQKQKGGYIVGHELKKELEARGGNVSAKVLDYLVEHPELWPESWKKDSKGNTIYVFFWDDIFRGSDGGLFVRCGYWIDGEVVSSYYWLGGGWDASGPSASLAS